MTSSEPHPTTEADVPVQSLDRQHSVWQHSVWQHSVWTGSIWSRALLWLMLSLTGLLFGWHLNVGGHTRLPLASQTAPALPELRAETTSSSSVQGTGEAAQTLFGPPLPRWTELAAAPTKQGFVTELDLTLLGRMNLDGG